MPKTVRGSVASSGTQAQFLSVKEAAEVLRISPVSIRRFLGQKKLRRYKVGARTLLRYDEVMGLVHAE